MTLKRVENKSDQLGTSGPKQQQGGKFPSFFVWVYAQGLELQKVNQEKANWSKQNMSQQMSPPSGQRQGKEQPSMTGKLRQ